MENIDMERLRNIFTDTRTIAIVGLSDNSARPSYEVADYLMNNGYRIIPVNPNCTEVLGEKCYASLRDIPEPIDMVNCFRKSSEIMPIAEDAIAIGAKTLWMQLDVIHQAAANKAGIAGLTVIMNHCIKIEHAKVFSVL